MHCPSRQTLTRLATLRVAGPIRSGNDGPHGVHEEPHAYLPVGVCPGVVNPPGMGNLLRRHRGQVAEEHRLREKEKRVSDSVDKDVGEGEERASTPQAKRRHPLK